MAIDSRGHDRKQPILFRLIAASTETGTDADLPYERGYLPALVVLEFEGAKPYMLRASQHGLRLTPYSHETRGATCVHCRVCMDRTPKRTVMGFKAHGPGEEDRRATGQGERAHAETATMTRGRGQDDPVVSALDPVDAVPISGLRPVHCGGSGV